MSAGEQVAWYMVALWMGGLAVYTWSAFKNRRDAERKRRERHEADKAEAFRTLREKHEQLRSEHNALYHRCSMADKKIDALETLMSESLAHRAAMEQRISQAAEHVKFLRSRSDKHQGRIPELEAVSAALDKRVSKLEALQALRGPTIGGTQP